MPNTHVHPCHAPAAVLERKIHDIEFFKDKSWIGGKEVRSYAKQHNLTFNEERLKRALKFEPLSPVTELEHMLASLERGEFAYPTSIVKAFAKKWNLTIYPLGLTALLAIEAKERELVANYFSVLGAARKVNEMLQAAERGGKRAPKESQIRAEAAKHCIPLDEDRLERIFG